MTAQLGVVIPTYRRVQALLTTLEHLSACAPAPAEILIHVDAGDTETGPAVETRFPQARLLSAETPQGPGGARNRLLRASTCPFVVSLDDDSYPVDPDFFAHVEAAFTRHPEAAVLAMSIAHEGEEMPPRTDHDHPAADFVGCGCAYRREAFLQTGGYLPLKLAYGMEEADLALQVLDQGWSIQQIGQLRVRHATDRGHQTAPRIVAAHIRNTALLAYLRYPPRLALYGVAQVANRVLYSTRRGHLLGVLRGLLSIPGALLRHRHARRPVAADTVRGRKELKTLKPFLYNRNN